MCGRYTLYSGHSRIAQQFDVPSPPTLMPRYNIAPTQAVAIVRIDKWDASARELALVQWGLVPGWAKDRTIGNRLINARAETVADKPAFRAAFRRRRCLIPADGFYEWQQTPTGKQPFYIRARDEGLLAFAGLWERWERDEESLESCTIITTQANEQLRPLHARMPVIISPDDFGSWLDPANRDTESLVARLRPYPTDTLAAFPVSTHVNTPQHEDRRCIEPVR